MKISNFLNEKIIVPLADRYSGSGIMKYYKMIKTMSAWTPEEIRNWQNERLRDLIEHAYHNTQYYQDLFDSAGLTPSDIKDMNDLNKIPILTKEDIIKSPEKFIPQNISDIKYRNDATGGSTGTPFRFMVDLKSFSYLTAMHNYYLGRVGYRLGDKLLVLGGSSINPAEKLSFKYKLYRSLTRRTFLGGVNMSDEIADQYLKIITRKKIEYIYGFATAIYLLACRAEKTKVRLPRIKACVTTAEMLLDEYREKIESAFDCQVMDAYGAADGGITAYESEPGIYEVGYSCILEIEKSVSENNTGNLLTTDLLNFALPFIRYRIGDQISILDKEKSTQYYNGQIITKIWGRIPDIMKLENGRILTGSPFAHLFRLINVKAYRIKKVGYMHIECAIQRTDLFSKDEEDVLISAFKKHAGQECKITITEVENFEPLPSGKRNYFISNSE